MSRPPVLLGRELPVQMRLFGKKDFIERRIYFFTCKKCKKPKRQTFFKERLKGRLCRICRAFKVDPDQMTLMGESENEK